MKSLITIADDTGEKTGPLLSFRDDNCFLWLISNPFESVQKVLFASKPSKNLQLTVVKTSLVLELSYASTSNSNISSKKSENLSFITPN